MTKVLCITLMSGICLLVLQNLSVILTFLLKKKRKLTRYQFLIRHVPKAKRVVWQYVGLIAVLSVFAMMMLFRFSQDVTAVENLIISGLLAVISGVAVMEFQKKIKRIFQLIDEEFQNFLQKRKTEMMK